MAPRAASSEGSPSPTPSALAFGFTSLQMFSPTVGWALSWDLDSARNRVLRTSDGGSTWSDLTPSGIDGDDSGVVASFLDESHAWVAWPHRRSDTTTTVTVFATTDRGRSWRSNRFTSTPGWDGQVQFVDPRHGWAVAVIAAGLGHDPVEVWRTRDGGRTWRPVSASSDPYFPDLPRSTPKALPPCGATATFVDRSTGFAVGGCPNRNELFVTHDAGRSWLRIRMFPPPPEGGGPGVPSFSSPLHGFLPVFGPQGQGVVRLYFTHDGGRSWTRARLPVEIIEAGPAFSDPRHGWFYGEGKVYTTADGGAHWSSFSTNLCLAGSNLEFVDLLHGWAFSQDPEDPFLLRTEDGGRSWTTLPATITG